MDFKRGAKNRKRCQQVYPRRCGNGGSSITIGDRGGSGGGRTIAAECHFRPSNEVIYRNRRAAAAAVGAGWRYHPRPRGLSRDGTSRSTAGLRPAAGDPGRPAARGHHHLQQQHRQMIQHRRRISTRGVPIIRRPSLVGSPRYQLEEILEGEEEEEEEQEDMATAAGDAVAAPAGTVGASHAAAAPATANGGDDAVDDCDDSASSITVETHSSSSSTSSDISSRGCREPKKCSKLNASSSTSSRPSPKHKTNYRRRREEAHLSPTRADAVASSSPPPPPLSVIVARVMKTARRAVFSGRLHSKKPRRKKLLSARRRAFLTSALACGSVFGALPSGTTNEYECNTRSEYVRYTSTSSRVFLFKSQDQRRSWIIYVFDGVIVSSAPLHLLVLTAVCISAG